MENKKAKLSHEDCPGSPVEVWAGWVWITPDGKEHSWSKRETKSACEEAVTQAVERLGVEGAFTD